MTNRNFLVGLFVLAGLTLFTAGLFLIGNRHEAFARHIEYYAEFANLSGLAKGSKVQVAGMDAGQIVDIAVPQTPSSKFRAHIRINESFHGLIRTDSIATVGTEGVVGNTFLMIHPGSPKAPAAPPQFTLSSKEPTELADLLDQSKGLLTDMDSTVKNANGLLTSVGGNLNGTLTGVRTTMSNANDIVLGVKEGRGPAGMLLRDRDLAAQIRQTVSNVQTATVNLGHAASQADELVSAIQSQQLPQKIDGTMNSVKSAASNLDAASRQIRQTISEATSPDTSGVSAGVNIRESLSNVDSATANMADETEALKHNFFFRGFFHHRGYYNLAHLPPDKYRQDRLFTNPANIRVWLPGDQLFEAHSSGKEQLTSKGKALLDSTVAQFGDAIVESPTIIEGYSSYGDAADQLAQSQNRAILIRNYLQSHFQWNPGTLGLVPMRNLPPSGLTHMNWDGICIVLVKAKS